ncbi:MAG: helix-turn-helix transcriptional regulator [Bacteroidota bacterium]
MDIGKAIKTIRKEKGLSQEQLGAKIGLSDNAISQIETGATFPQKDNIKKICEALEIPVGYLLFFSISDEDLPEDGRAIFNALQQPIKQVLIEDIKARS